MAIGAMHPFGAHFSYNAAPHRVIQIERQALGCRPAKRGETAGDQSRQRGELFGIDPHSGQAPQAPVVPIRQIRCAGQASRIHHEYGRQRAAHLAQ